MRRAYAALILLFVLVEGVAEACEIVGKPCDQFDWHTDVRPEPGIWSQVNKRWQKERGLIANRVFITVFDVSRHSSRHRFLVVDLEGSQIWSYLAAHGKGSDPDHDGFATLFSDEPGSKMTPLGFFKTAETYVGRHGQSLRLDGLDPENKNSRKRSIVIHGADYVDSKRTRIGRSWGCPALESPLSAEVIDRIKGGALLFIYRGSTQPKVSSEAAEDYPNSK